eukprot:TRINITY_DN15007_c0_g1_i1.p1 TRINITY_DN15007_c0_g1~~TRINITY_DN15007_c0_g1_i1.p1  ORF type:complete len:569 (-),score=101.84 TRINITY_DN15007_c0_g1_i1:104-1810(-)
MANARDKSYNKFLAFDHTFLKKSFQTGVACLIILTLTLFTLSFNRFYYASQEATTPIIIPTDGHDLIRDSLDSINFLHFNDVYEVDGTGPNSRKGGAARVSTLIHSLRLKDPSIIVSFAGDMISPSLLSTSHQGKHMIELQNTLTLDFACLGNHDFDMGVDVLLARIQESKFTWLNSNMYLTQLSLKGKQKKILLPGTTENIVLERRLPLSGRLVRIGVFGLVYDFLGSTKNRTSLVVNDPHLVAVEQIKKLKKQNVTMIVALTHLTWRNDCLLSRENPGIDLILGGHDHSSMLNTQCGRAPVVKSTSDWRDVWTIQASFTKTNEVLFRFLNQPITEESFVKDVDVVEVVERYKKAAGITSELIAVAKVDFDTTRRSLRSRETNAGNLVAESIRLAFSADVGFTNAGSIRSGPVFKSGHKFTREELMRLVPYGNSVFAVRVNGSVLVRALEHGLSIPGRGAFPHVDGIRVTYCPPGPRICSLTFANGSRVMAESVLTVALDDFVLSGGDGYLMLINSELVNDHPHGLRMADLVIDTMKRKSYVDSQVDGRMKEVSDLECKSLKANSSW